MNGRHDTQPVFFTVSSSLQPLNQSNTGTSVKVLDRFLRTISETMTV